MITVPPSPPRSQTGFDVVYNQMTVCRNILFGTNTQVIHSLAFLRTLPQNNGTSLLAQPHSWGNRITRCLTTLCSWWLTPFCLCPCIDRVRPPPPFPHPTPSSGGTALVRHPARRWGGNRNPSLELRIPTRWAGGCLATEAQYDTAIAFAKDEYKILKRMAKNAEKVKPASKFAGQWKGAGWDSYVKIRLFELFRCTCEVYK